MKVTMHFLILTVSKFCRKIICQTKLYHISGYTNILEDKANIFSSTQKQEAL